MINYGIILVALATILQCGEMTDKHDGESRIVGGEIANKGQFLFPVSLQYYGQHICGGSLIRNDTVLTAAHCVEDTKPDHYKVAAGIFRLKNIPKNSIMKVTKIVKHKMYGINESYVHDIAVLKVKTRTGHSGKIIQLNDKPVKEGANCTVVGWGDLYQGSNYGSDALRFVNISIVSRVLCAKIYQSLLTNDMLCAGQSGKDSCQGDSGGPLVCDNKLTGIVSFGAGCGDVPGVYTDVSHYLTWIKKAQNDGSVIKNSLYLPIISVITIVVNAMH